MAYTYSTYVTALSTETIIDATDENFVAILPTIINQAEQRCYRETDLLSTVVRDSTATLTANSRDFTLPSGSGRFVTTQGFNVYTPVGLTTTRNPVVVATRDYIDMVWPSDTAASATTIPTHFAMITDQTVIFGPPPGDAFIVEVIGTIRPEALSSSNTETFLSLYLPDLFFAASMVAMSAYMRNFGAQSDDPKMAQSWENQYQIARQSAMVEELRKKWQSVSWTSLSPSPLATPPRS